MTDSIPYTFDMELDIFFVATEMETTPEEIIKQLNNNSGLKAHTFYVLLILQ